MRFHVIVGVMPHEQERAQPLEIDVTVWPALRTGEGAQNSPRDAGAVVDYRQLYDDVAARVTAAPLRYLEDLARALVDDLLARASVRRARVAVRKPHVALPGPLAYAEVVVDSGQSGPDA